MIGIVPIAIGTGLVFPSVQAGSVVGMPPEQFATATGLNQTVQRMGSAIGNAIAIAFVASVGPAGAFDRIFVVMLLSSIVMLPAALSLAPGRTRLAEPAAT
jgi:hypothetical protein